jgi:hypothetical protein
LDPDDPAPTSRAKSGGHQVVLRVAVGMLLVGTIALLFWGARWQEPRKNPFATPGFWSWLLTPEPHRGYQGMPLVPLGNSLGLNPQGLCSKPDLCGGLKPMPDGQVQFRDDTGVDRVAVRVHGTSTPGHGHGLALTSSGQLFALAEGKPPVWREVSLPALDGQFADFLSVDFSPDGLKILTTSSDRTARIWDAATFAEIAVLRGHKDWVNSAAFSRDGRLIVTASNDNTARIWDAATAKEIAVLRGHESQVNSAAFSPDGRLIVTASNDNTARIWDAATAKEIAVLRGHQDWVNSAAFSPDGRRIFTTSADNTVRIWDAATFAEIAVLRGHQDWVNSAAFSRDGRRIVTASNDNTARIWDAATFAVIAVLRGTSAAIPIIQGLASSSGGAVWAVGSGGYAAHSWDAQSWTTLKPSDKADLLAVAAIGNETGVALSADRKLVFLKVSAESLGTQRSDQQKQQQVPTIDARTVEVSLARPLRLRTLAFLSSNEGWVAGDGGIIFHTTDGGSKWSLPLHEKDALTLTDLHIESSHVGWALGRYADGRQTVIAADKAEAAQGPDGWSELPHYVGPWYFLLGIPALLLLGFLMLRAWRSDPAPPQESIEEVATSDTPLRWNDPDASVLRPLARGLSRFLRNVNTRPPLTLAITGRWGSGKSSLMSLLMSNLQYYGGRAVWFNAWHHREEEHLLAALFEAIRRNAPPGWWSWPGLAFRVRLLWRRSKRPLANLVYLTLFAGIALITLHAALPAFHAEELARMVHSAATIVGKPVADTWLALATLAGSGGIALFALWLRGKLVALPANPAKLALAVARRASLGDFSDKLAFRDRFGEQFDDVCNALLTRTSPGLVILIDDLDRCQPEDVLKILEAVNYLVSAAPCIIVLGMDRRQIEYCVGLGFEKLVEGLPEDELVYATEETPDKAGKQRAFARHYLEKLINIEVPVPALDDAATDSLLLRGTTPGKPDDADPPNWLGVTKGAMHAAFQIARVGLFAFVAGVLLTWSVEQLREVGVTVLPAPSAPISESTIPQNNPASTPAAAEVQPQGQQQDKSFAPARVDVVIPPTTREVPASRRWLWWAPTILMIGISLLFGVAAAVHQRRQVVLDSPRFAKALQAVKPLLTAINATPRAIKRYQNRMRYLAARLRPAVYEPDSIDSLLHWLGERLGRPLVPASWFDEQPRQTIDEPALILLGALELFAPKAFANPAELFTRLEHGTPGDKPSEEQAEAWSKVREAFATQGLAMPTAAEVARYATFVLNKEKSAPTHSADVVPFSRESI